MDVEALFRTHRESLFRFLSRLTRDPDLAEDALQETFVRCLRRPPARPEHVRAWLFKVGANVVRDSYRSRARHDELLAATDPAIASSAVQDPLDAVQAGEQRDRIARAILELSERERTAVMMREEGFAHREIAQAIGTTTGTIGTLLARAFDKLAHELTLDGDP